jgi:hypothetical protein
MRRFLVLLAALFVMQSSQAGIAQSNAPANDIPNILGTWTLVSADGIFGDHIVTELSGTEIIIDMQQNAVFSGSLSYEVEDEDLAFHDGSGHTRMASEPFLGVVNWDNRSLTIAERADTSVMAGTLLNSETMAMVYVEPGEHAFAARMLFVRQ